MYTETTNSRRRTHAGPLVCIESIPMCGAKSVSIWKKEERVNSKSDQATWPALVNTQYSAQCACNKNAIPYSRYLSPQTVLYTLF
jgi:hypothetical protein